MRKFQEYGLTLKTKPLPNTTIQVKNIKQFQVLLNFHLFFTDATVNQALVATIVEELVSRNISVGIYTTKTYWTNIMASNPNYGQFPLWYPRYDGVDSFDFFVPFSGLSAKLIINPLCLSYTILHLIKMLYYFSGWEKLAIKQTAGDAPICGISQIDLDYFE